ncbi:MAG: DUF6495 family protein [Flavobacteriaceae bacterium]
MKYRRLTKEQFEELHKEFINFLATQSITADEWSKLKLEKLELASSVMDVFSDLVWEGVLSKVKYLENISSKHIYLFQVLNNSISLIGVKINIDLIDLTTEEGFSWLRENLMSENVEIFNSKKEFSEDIKLNVFKLIEQGASITKGELFKYFDKLIG